MLMKMGGNRRMLFSKRGVGISLFQQLLGPNWCLEAELVDGKIQAYATESRSAVTYDLDPYTNTSTAGLPGKIRNELLRLVHMWQAERDDVHNFTSWLFKWDSKDHAYEISAGDWDPRDL